MVYVLIVIIALLLLFKSKAIIGFLDRKLLLKIRLISFVCAVIACSIIAAGSYSFYEKNNRKDNSSLSSYNNSPEPKEKGCDHYVIDGDTIAELLSIEGTASNIWTKRTYEKGDEILVQTIINKMLPGYIGMTHFLFTEKFADENFYAYYNNGQLTIKVSPEEKIAGIKEEMKAPISGSGLDYVTRFFAKLDKFKGNVRDYDNDASLKKELIRFQTKNFPKARKEYFNHVKNALWEKDIEVKLNGKNISYIGYMFVRNKVIKDTYEQIAGELERLRFKRVTFYWAEGQDGTYWNIPSKEDKDL